MPRVVAYFLSRGAAGPFADVWSAAGAGLIAVLHLVAVVVMIRTEHDLLGRTLFVAIWGMANFGWLVLLRRPAIAALLSLALVTVLIQVSLFKFDVTWMTLSFFDVLLIDPETVAFLFNLFPKVRTAILVGILVAVPALYLVWRLDPYRIRRRTAAGGWLVCLSGVMGLSILTPVDPSEPFQGRDHVSLFARSGATAVAGLLQHGLMEADASVSEQLKGVTRQSCEAAGKRPHIIMVLDESSFDFTAAPGVKVPAGYKDHFRSFDGQQRNFVVESYGGPTWYAEYSVLTGLSARSHGRFMFYVTRIAADRVKRGLPQALQRCGYKTFTLYPVYGAFLSAKRFQKTAGVQSFIDQDGMGAGEVEPDSFYLDQAKRLIEREGKNAPLFIFAYVAANHFPWTSSYRPDLTPGWRAPGNSPEVDEYLRRQAMSAHDYRAFLAQLKREHPDERFLVVRFGDHQPNIAAKVLEPRLPDAAIAKRVMEYDPRFFTTYYALDAVNFRPVDTSSALGTLDAAYLPIVVQEAAGLSLDASFAEQKKILMRCNGVFYGCRDGAEARRFNRLLMDAGLINGL